VLFPVIVEIEFPESGGFFLKGEFWEPLHILAGYRIWCGVRPRDESDFVNGAGRKEINLGSLYRTPMEHAHCISLGCDFGNPENSRRHLSGLTNDWKCWKGNILPTLAEISRAPTLEQKNGSLRHGRSSRGRS
jgi:hypothetical protein